MSSYSRSRSPKSRGMRAYTPSPPRRYVHSSVCSELASYHLKCLPAVSMSANKVVQLLPGMPSNGTQHSML